MDKVWNAIERLRMASKLSLEMYGKPLTICYSGGKDSQVLVRLAIEACIPFTAKHSLTTVDAPETVGTVKRTFEALCDRGIEAVIEKPEFTMWQLIPKKKMPPTRLVRYCCKYLKERGTAKGDFIATGVRHAESSQRRNRGVVDGIAKKKEERERYGDEVFLANDNSEKRRQMERCMAKNAMCVNPIIDWSDRDVFSYYWSECKEHNTLYMDGFVRVGCIGCPMASTRQRRHEFARWPMYERAYKRAFGKMLAQRRADGKEYGWQSVEEVFHWWMNDGWDKDQMVLWGEDDG